MAAINMVLTIAGLLAGVVLLWRLPTVPPASRGGINRAVSVIIPARNEEQNLPRLLASLEVQEHRPHEVIVVDDGSTDATADVVRRAGVTLIAAPPLPEGWLGKPWACQHGVAIASGERLLFLDADTRLAPDAIQRLLAAHADLAPDGLLSVQPYHEVQRPYEQLSAVCGTVPVLASGMAAVRPTHSARVAFGPCLLTRVDALAAAGGFQAVAGEVVEDAALARGYRAAGRPVVCLGGGDAVRFRMYPDGVGSVIEGWTKSLAGGAIGAAWAPAWGTVLWVAAGLAIVGDSVADPSVAAAAAWALFALEVWWMLRRLGSFHPISAVLFPAPLLAFVVLFARSGLLRTLGRPVRWRGRRIDPRGGTVT